MQDLEEDASDEDSPKFPKQDPFAVNGPPVQSDNNAAQTASQPAAPPREPTAPADRLAALKARLEAGRNKAAAPQAQPTRQSEGYASAAPAAHSRPVRQTTDSVPQASAPRAHFNGLSAPERILQRAATEKQQGNTTSAPTTEAVALAEAQKQIEGLKQELLHQREDFRKQVHQGQQNAELLQQQLHVSQHQQQAQLQEQQEREMSFRQQLDACQSAEDHTQEVQQLQSRLAEQEGQIAQLRAQVKSLKDEARDGEATAAARVPELKWRIDELTAAQQEAATAARERDEEWRQELEVQRDAAEEAQAQLQARLQASHSAEASQQDQLQALATQHAAGLRSARQECTAERDDYWQERVQDLQMQYTQLQSTLDAEVAARHAHEAELEGTSEARHQALLAQEEACSQKSRADQLAQELEQTRSALEASRSAASAAETLHEQTEGETQRQLLGLQAETSQLQAQVAELSSQQQQSGDTASGVLDADLAALRTELEATCAERDQARQQLSRLKQAMVAEQEDEEDKVRWRVDAEVKLAREDLLAQEAERTASHSTASASMQAELNSAMERIHRMDADLNAWEAAVASRDVELANLQSALGELAYESEAAERLRAELRALQRSLEESQGEVASAKAAQEQAVAGQQAAEAQAAAAKEALQQQKAAEAGINEEAAMLRRAVGESMRKMSALTSDSNALVDRRILGKLVVTYFERGQSADVLALMARMLALTEEDKGKIGLASSKRGYLRSISALPGSLVRGTVSLVGGGGSRAPGAEGDSLADQWLEFLIQQEQAAEAEDAQKGADAGSIPADTYVPPPAFSPRGDIKPASPSHAWRHSTPG
ncbi:hypothetical protein WJX73_004216 [Symbiochloris irregularis]|uniref:GRIP domain-containing protein n=1 Tax=Symbiochloris irregularis TaxID=706552 RepID=A0AAW1PDB8_9CHLO